MRAFADLFDRVDRTTSTNAKVEAIADHLRSCAPGDAAWAVYFLAGERLKRLVPAANLRAWAREEAGIEPWLFDECYATVGDLAETIALLAAGGSTAAAPQEPMQGAAPAPAVLGVTAGEGLESWIVDRLLPLRHLDEPEQRDAVVGWWRALGARERFILTKLLTGALRVGVSRGLVERAVAEAFDLPRAVVAHRLMGEWTPGEAWFDRVRAAEGTDAEAVDRTKPYPFYLASPISDPADSLGPRDRWMAERKWDGIRAQLIRRGGEITLWSRGEENITERFPELVEAAVRAGGSFVADGEVLCWDLEQDRPLPFSVLQTRIGRKTVSERTRAGAPAVFLAYDLLEVHGEDLRITPQHERRARLESVAAEWPSRLRTSPLVTVESWEALAVERSRSRELGVEGLMLKERDGPYRDGRTRGGWWKWKIDPLSIDAVLLYAQPGRGRRANLLTDYTFGLWTGATGGVGELITIAKAYSGLDQSEIEELDRWIRRHTTERFGPVRACQPTRVFELAFEGIARSSRHKSGLALRFPRIARPRPDKAASDANTMADAFALFDEVSR